MPKFNKKEWQRKYMAQQRANTDPIAEILKEPLETVGEVDLDRQLLLIKDIIRKDIFNIRSEVSQGKLKASSSESLGLYARILSTMKKEQKDYLDSLSDEELEKLANGTNQKGAKKED